MIWEPGTRPTTPCEIGVGTRSGNSVMRWCPIRKRMVGAHRLAVETAIGRLLDPTEFVMHTCDNPPCVALDHLVVGTGALNMQDAVAKRRQHQVVKTHCPHGHPYVGDNLYVTKTGARQCKTCTRRRNAAWRERTV